MKKCGTCRHWHKGAQHSLYPSADPERGNCDAIKHESESEPTALAFAGDTSGLGSAWLETLADFGCVLHTEASTPVRDTPSTSVSNLPHGGP